MKKAMVISGGGSKGAYAVGILKHLDQNFEDLDFDIFVGTSTGSLIAGLAALGRIKDLEKLYTTKVTSDIIIKHNIGQRAGADSIFEVEPLWDLISSIYDDQFYDELQNSGKEIYLNTTCMQTEELVVFTNATDPAESKYYETRKLHDADHFRMAVLASACQPVFMTPVKVNLNVPGEPNPDFQYVDGGVREYAGVQMAIDNGAEEIFTVLLSAKNATPDTTILTSLFPVLERTIAIFTADVGKNDLIIPFQYNDALKYIDAVKKKMKREGVSQELIDKYFFIRGRENPFEDKVPLKIHVLQPETSLGGGAGGLDFIPKDMKLMLAKGQAAAQDFVASLAPGEVDWV